MKCPKCGYLGFETVDRCRNCGYDFSLASTPPSSAELPLNESKGGGPWADFELAARPGSSPAAPVGADPAGTSLTYQSRDSRHATEVVTPPALDLDRLIGSDPEPAPVGSPSDRPASERGEDEPPLASRPRPVGPPLVVRRTTPEIPRGRPRGGRPPRREERPLLAEPEIGETAPAGPAAWGAEAGEASALSPGVAQAARVFEPASRAARLVAAAIDLLLLGGINAAILYLTLGFAGLTAADWMLLPPIPMGSFLLLLNLGYLTAFTAAGGRTIGKMMTGIRVIADDGRATDVSAAVLRAIGCVISAAALGLPYLPALLAPDGRPLADRLAGTRVVRAD
jgi:uncharacterized RDD family membrane protein YckC